LLSPGTCHSGEQDDGKPQKDSYQGVTF
jgi:hypothetical protein